MSMVIYFSNSVYPETVVTLNGDFNCVLMCMFIVVPNFQALLSLFRHKCCPLFKSVLKVSGHFVTLINSTTNDADSVYLLQLLIF